MNYSVPFGKEKLVFKIPSNYSVTKIESKKLKPVYNVYEKTKESLLNPINSPPLDQLLQSKNSICIVVTDITRMSPDKELLIPLLETIEKKIKRENITILIASGMHKKMSLNEKIEKYGKNIVDHYKIIDHDASDNGQLISLGITSSGIPIHISKIALDSDFLISLGVVEPHQFAGYSGGYKTVAIGLAGDSTISLTHSVKMLKKSNTRVGQIDQNPIQKEIIEIGKKTNLDFIVNVILSHEKEILDVCSGEPFHTHKLLVTKARKIYEVPLEKSYSIIICGVGYPRDTNLYQATRSASYLYYARKPIINKGGFIIIPAPCQEGSGLGIGEKRFYSFLKNNSITEILESSIEFKAGEQRAFFIANVLKDCNIIIVGSKKPEIIKQAKMIPARTMDDAFAFIKQRSNYNHEILLIPNSLITLPIIQ